MVSKLMGYRHLSCVLVMGLSITSCSDDTIKPSSETFSSAANVHSNEQLITQTAEIDEQLEENLGAILGGQSPLFDIETQLVERKVIPDTREINPLDGTQERNVYYGDLHVHTAYSFDASLYFFSVFAFKKFKSILKFMIQ